jgi:hypothetical protein
VRAKAQQRRLYLDRSGHAQDVLSTVWIVPGVSDEPSGSFDPEERLEA